ncbi:MAG: NAD(P)-binding protein, partial [Acidimicrobiales bacterium]|nr:NAD(P)-binding protein [Acidimicrobiales bacterium]
TDVAVVGGGVAGLVAAATAATLGCRCTLVEPRRLGGRARTDERSGFTFNGGPRALYVGGPAERALTALDIPLAGGKPALDRAIAVRAGRAHRFPHGPGALLSTSLLPGRARAAAVRALAPLLHEPKRVPSDASLAAWLDRRRVSGPARELVESLVRLATYVDAPELLPASVGIRAAWNASTLGVRYLDGGFGTIVAGLEAAAATRGVEIAPASAAAVSPDRDRWVVDAGDVAVVARCVIVAVGTPSAAVAILGEHPESWGVLGPRITASCLELGTDRVPHRRFALGTDEPTYLSVHAPPARLAPPGGAVVHAMRYRRPGDLADPGSTKAQLEALVRLSGIDASSIVAQRYLHEMVVHGSIPTVTGGGLAGRPPIELVEMPGVLLAGDWVGPTGMLLDAAVASGVDAGRRAAERWTTMAVA